MRQTLEELVDSYMKTEKLEYYNDLSYRDLINLMKLVRQNTLIEAANNADADYTNHEQIEVYVLKESILQLDKNSIKI